MTVMYRGKLLYLQISHDDTAQFKHIIITVWFTARKCMIQVHTGKATHA